MLAGRIGRIVFRNAILHHQVDVSRTARTRPALKTKLETDYNALQSKIIAINDPYACVTLSARHFDPNLRPSRYSATHPNPHDVRHTPSKEASAQADRGLQSTIPASSILSTWSTCSSTIPSTESSRAKSPTRMASLLLMERPSTSTARRYG